MFNPFRTCFQRGSTICPPLPPLALTAWSLTTLPFMLSGSAQPRSCCEHLFPLLILSHCFTLGPCSDNHLLRQAFFPDHFSKTPLFSLSSSTSYPALFFLAALIIAWCYSIVICWHWLSTFSSMRARNAAGLIYCPIFNACRVLGTW